MRCAQAVRLRQGPSRWVGGVHLRAELVPVRILPALGTATAGPTAPLGGWGQPRARLAQHQLPELWTCDEATRCVLSGSRVALTTSFVLFLLFIVLKS